jgi:gluconokinase
MTAFVLMGVAGSGKTTVGSRVAEALGLPFVEGDRFHSAENIASMSSGIPLSDAARVRWIDDLVATLNARVEKDVVVACSALSRFVRDRLRAGLAENVEFIWLTADPKVVAQRLEMRSPHFMKSKLLASQFAALQDPDAAHRVSTHRPLEDTVREVAKLIERLRAHSS